MTDTTSAPIILEIKPADPARGDRYTLNQWSSYSFDRNMLTPASPFRFTAEGADKAQRKKIRSGDSVSLLAPNGALLASGYIDDTSTVVTPARVGYTLTGRDTIGQLVDNASVDVNNEIIRIKKTNVLKLAETLRQNTQIPAPVLDQGCPNAGVLLQMNPGETKINALQRYLEYANCLVWSAPNGQMIVGKPNMSQPKQGQLVLRYSNPAENNLLEARVNRAPHTAARLVAVQLQNLQATDIDTWTVANQDEDVKKLARIGGGRSIFRTFTLGNNGDGVNQLVVVGQNGGIQAIGRQLALREIARENLKVLDVEVVLRGHINGFGIPYMIDQVYNVIIEDDDVEENLYVYACKYDFDPARGKLTTLRLCKMNSLVADVAQRSTNTTLTPGSTLGAVV